ncbi:hypothetical protein SAMN05421805_1193 [Saccharopolyspora antimicrobica]|uniref:Uncharacterized protein n=1 Tax=Saccharopolyspora antimicrobica TaxID=455193 RepID=A0A1I5IKW0_9PSEU|nr:hypothetical protein ATL45_2323 [Saccharopolyspora antimicrobica]SFO61084.1 hypothetical protein SAMN05421805_1193 [Saccharopolyspora antimicrobica]
MAVRENELRCHELLLRLADRLPDQHLWRFRDWLAGDAADVIAQLLPGTLVRERIGLEDDEHRLLAEALLPLGADPAMVNAVLPAEPGTTPQHAFTTESPGNPVADSALLVLGATLRSRPGVREVRNSWRSTDGGAAKLVLLVTASADVVGLTGEIQRVLRALGEPEPRVEVLPPEQEPTAYHRAALAESALVCAGAEELAGRRG